MRDVEYRRTEPRTGIDLLLGALIRALQNGDLEDDPEWIVAFVQSLGRLPAEEEEEGGVSW